MAAIKPLADSSGKYVKRAEIADVDYQRGVETTPKDWQGATLAGAENWKTGIQQAVSANRFATRVRASSTEKWRRRAVEVGKSRFPEGVRVARGEWENGFNPYHQAFNAFRLPERGARRSRQNITRATAVMELFSETFVRVTGGTPTA